MNRSIFIFAITVFFASKSFSSEKTFRTCLQRPDTHQVQCVDDENSLLRQKQKALIAKIQKQLTYCEIHWVGYDAKQAIKELSQAQQHWRKFVKHDCEYGDEIFGQGTARAFEFGRCEMEHLRMRNKKLSKALEDLRYKHEMLRDWDKDQGNENGGFIQCPAK